MSKEAMKLALEALKTCDVVDYQQDFDSKKVNKAITALREALAEQPAQQEHFDHKAAANAALRDAQNRSYQVAKSTQPAQQRPQNCGTGYCSCIECPYEQPSLAQPAREPLTPAQKIALAEDWFAEDWAITKAVGMMVEYEMRIAHGITKGNT